MRRAISIAGVRPLDWIARASAPSAVAWHCPAQSRGAARGARCGDGATRACATWRWAWERAMIMRVSAQGQAYGYLCAREQLDESPCCTSPKRESSASGVVTRVIAAEHRIQVFVRFWRSHAKFKFKFKFQFKMAVANPPPLCPSLARAIGRADLGATVTTG